VTAASPSPSAARLASPGELAAAVPLLCGFVPDESLVLVALHGPRRRVGLTARVDLPAPRAEDALAAALADRLGADGAERAAVIVLTERGGELPGAGLVRAVAAALSARGVVPDEQLLVRSGRWSSYRCSARCCPPEGTPLPRGDRGGLAQVAAELVLRGRAVLPSRAALARAVAAPAGAERRLCAARMLAATSARQREVAVRGRVAVGREDLGAWQRAVAVAEEGVLPGRAGGRDDDRLVVSLDDVLVRDEVLTWAVDRGGALLVVLQRLAAVAVPPHDVPVCAVLGWTAHAEGDGALARVALDRALAVDRRYGLAVLAAEALDGQVPPVDVRSVLVQARDVLRADHAWTGGWSQTGATGGEGP
jgi:hypothetical protein